VSGVRVFVGSAGSEQSLRIADAIKSNLEDRKLGEVQIWNEGVFRVSESTMEGLIQALDRFEYAVFVFHPEDVLVSGTSQKDAVRDNVLFELGLFAGALGLRRTAIVVPSDFSDLRIPSDLLGITMATYDRARAERDPLGALGNACNRMRATLEDAGQLPRDRGETRLLGIYDGPRGYYEAAVEMLQHECCSIALLQYSSTLILGAEEGSEDEARFYELLLRQARDSADLHHITSLSILQQHLTSRTRSYPDVLHALNELDRDSKNVRIQSKRPSRPIRVISESHASPGIPLELSTGQAFAVESKPGCIQALTVANIGSSTSCVRIAGPQMKGLLRKCESFYSTCELLDWPTLLDTLSKAGIAFE